MQRFARSLSAVFVLAVVLAVAYPAIGAPHVQQLAGMRSAKVEQPSTLGQVLAGLWRGLVGAWGEVEAVPVGPVVDPGEDKDEPLPVGPAVDPP